MTVHMLEKETQPNGSDRMVLKPILVKLGISDGTHTEVTEGLKEGDSIVMGTVTSPTTSASPAPMANPFGGMGRR